MPFAIARALRSTRIPSRAARFSQALNTGFECGCGKRRKTIFCYLARDAVRPCRRDRRFRLAARAGNPAAPSRRRAADVARVHGSQEPRTGPGNRRACLRRDPGNARLAPGGRAWPCSEARLGGVGFAHASRAGMAAVHRLARTQLRPRRAPFRASARSVARALARGALCRGARLRAQAAALEKELLASLSAASPRAAPPG